MTHDFHPFGLTDSNPWSVYGELLVGRWFVQDRNDDGRGSYTQAGIAPAVRYRFGGGPFLEAGVGLDVITPHFRDGDRRFSTSFNFADHVAVGYRFGEARENEVALRVEHFSNGGIRNPNPGQNFAELRYGRRF